MNQRRLILVLILALASCAKKKENDKANTGTGSGTASSVASGSSAATGSAAPTPPADENATFYPKCATLFPKELAATTHGADAVETTSEGQEDAECSPMKGGEAVGRYAIHCAPGFDKDAAATFDVERQAQTAAKALDPAIGRPGYTLGDTSFMLLDDDTPCRLHVSWMTAPTADAAKSALTAIMAKVTPASIK